MYNGLCLIVIVIFAILFSSNKKLLSQVIDPQVGGRRGQRWWFKREYRGLMDAGKCEVKLWSGDMHFRQLIH